MSDLIHSGDDHDDDARGVRFFCKVNPSVIESEDHERRPKAKEMLKSQLVELPSLDLYYPPALLGAVFVGHLVTDLDSIAGAIGAAELYGGVAARASEVNSETAFALRYWKADVPPPIEELLARDSNARVCLVDHQQTSQLNPAIDPSRIVGVIDHHALQNSTIVTDLPIYMDIRPWGSMSTIIGHSFLSFRKRPSTSTAGLLLCAILSDTLNLMGPTTTEWDKNMVSALAEMAGVSDIQALATQQFKAKSRELATLSSDALVIMDQKAFSCEGDNFKGTIGFAVVETVDDAVIYERTADLLVSIAACKKAKGLDGLFLAVVNIAQLKSSVLLCSDTERSLACASWRDGSLVPSSGGGPSGLMDLGGLVSRKKDFVPAVTRAIKSGWGI